jgi:hypothetical protein
MHQVGNKTALTAVKTSSYIACDSCKARSRFQVVLKRGELFFCAHHLNKNRSHLEALGAQIIPLEV